MPEGRTIGTGEDNKKMNGNSLTRNEKEKKKQRNHDEEEEEAQVGVPRLQDILHRTGPTAFSI